MFKRITLFCLSAACIVSMTACGDSEETASSSVSTVSETVSVESAVESDVEETDASMEESAEEEVELTIDEQFAAFTADAEGICLKLQVYNQKGMPVKYGILEISETSTSTALETVYTDNAGYAFISNLELDKTYQLTITAEDGTPVGTVPLKMQSGDEYTGETDDSGTMLLTISDGLLSSVDLAITATDEDGTISSFSLSRIAPWSYTPETSSSTSDVSSAA